VVVVIGLKMNAQVTFNRQKIKEGKTYWNNFKLLESGILLPI
jgi:hypothetical protein